MTYVEGMYPVSARKTVDGWATPGLAYEDYTRMSTQQRKQSGERRLPTPDWALSDKKLRLLLTTFMEERAGFRRKQKGNLRERLGRAQEAVISQRPRLKGILAKLCKEYVRLKQLGLNPETTDEQWNAAREQPFMTVQDPENGVLFEAEARHEAERKRRRELEIEIEGIDTYLRYTANGGADVIAAIVYLYFRAALDSVGVGAELGLKPPHVRQTIWRLYQTASKLWPPEHSGVNVGSGTKDEQNGQSNIVANSRKNTNRIPDDGSSVSGVPEPLFACIELAGVLE